jgi:copper chaperone CopZ
MKGAIVMMKAIFQVGPFECAGCTQKIEEQLKGQVGVTKVKVFPQLRKIRTEFDETKISIRQMEEILRKWGYPIQANTLSNKGR